MSNVYHITWNTQRMHQNTMKFAMLKKGQKCEKELRRSQTHQKCSNWKICIEWCLKALKSIKLHEFYENVKIFTKASHNVPKYANILKLQKWAKCTEVYK